MSERAVALKIVVCVPFGPGCGFISSRNESLRRVRSRSTCVHVRVLEEEATHSIPHVLLISFAILSTRSLAVLTASASANSEMDTFAPAATRPTTDPATLSGSAIELKKSHHDRFVVEQHVQS
jgi:hypothetical protein